MTFFSLPSLSPGNGQSFPSSAFPCPESQGGYSQQPSWSEDCPQETPSVWDTAACVGSKVETHLTSHTTKFNAILVSL